MPTLSPSFNWGSELKNVNSTLYNQLNDSYSATARVVNTKVSRYITTSDPSSDSSVNATLQVGDLWINSGSNTAWIMTSRISTNSAVWTQIT